MLENRKLWFLYFLSLGLGLIVAGTILWRFGFNFYQGGDSPGYMTLARNLVEHGAFSFDAAAPFNPTNFRTPGYPLLLALVYRIFGSFVPAIFLGVLISAFAAPLVYLISRQLFSDSVAFWTGLISALEPMNLFLGVSILTEGIFTPILLLAVYFFIKYLKTANPSYIWKFSLFLALATLVRPIMFYFWPFACLFVVKKEFHLGIKTVLRKSFLLIAVFFVLISPWLLRNKVILDSWQITGLQGYIFFIDHYGAVLRYQGKAGPLSDVQSKALALVGPDKVFTPEGSSKLFKAAVDEIKKDKAAYLNIYLKSMIPFFASNGYKSLFIDILGLPAKAPSVPFELFLRLDFRGILATLHDMDLLGFLVYWGGKAFWISLSAVFFFTLIYLLLKSDYANIRAQVLFVAAVVFYFALITGPTAIGGGRTRAPINGLIFILSVFGVSQLWQKFARNNQ